MKKHVSMLVLFVLFASAGLSLAADPLICWFPPGWKSKAASAKQITDGLSSASGIAIRPRIAKSYPEILAAFSSDKPSTYGIHLQRCKPCLCRVLRPGDYRRS